MDEPQELMTLERCKTIARLQKALSKKEEIEFLCKRILTLLDEIKELAPEADPESFSDLISAVSRLGLLSDV